MRYRLVAADETVLEEGEGRAAVADTVLVLTPQLGQPLRIRPADVAAVRDTGPGALSIRLEGGPILYLEQLGRLHGQLLADLVQARGQDLTDALLLVGVGRPESFPGALGGVDAELRLYDDALVALPREGEPEQVPYAFVGDVVTDDSGYRIEVRTLDERTLVVQRLARRTGEFLELLRARVTAARGRTGHLVAALLPGLGPLAARSVAAVLLDGVAAPRSRLDAVEPTVFEALVRACATPDRLAGLELLGSLGELSFGLHQRTSVQREGWSTGSAEATPVQQVDHREPAAAPGGLAGVLQAGLTESLGQPGAGPPGLGDLLGYRLLGGVLPGTGIPGTGIPAAGIPGVGIPGTGTGGGLRHEHQPVPRAQPHQGRGRAASTDLQALQVGGGDSVIAFVFCRTPAGQVLFEVLSEPDHATYGYRAGPGQPAVNRALALLGFRVEAVYADAAAADSSYRRAVERLPYLRVLREAFLGRAIHGADWERQLRALLAG